MKKITNEEFEKRYRTIYSRIFTGQLMTDSQDGCNPNTFKSDSWKKALLPDFIACPEMEDRGTSGFFNALEVNGNGNVIVFSGFRDDVGVNVGSCQRDDAFDACSTITSPIFVFDESGDWGLISDFEEWSLLAGEPVFVDAVIEASGGVAEMKRKFIWYMEHMWGIADPARQNQFLALAGWDK